MVREMFRDVREFPIGFAESSTGFDHFFPINYE